MSATETKAKGGGGGTVQMVRFRTRTLGGMLAYRPGVLYPANEGVLNWLESNIDPSDYELVEAAADDGAAPEPLPKPKKVDRLASSKRAAKAAADAAGGAAT